MAGKKPLKPDDFPVHADKKNIKKNDGEPIAESSDEGTAEDIADRLNENEYQREEDRWSA
jgi:transposase